MTTEFVPTVQADIDMITKFEGNTIPVSIKLPSGAVVPTPDAGCVWRAKGGKLISEKGSVQNVMR